MKKTLLLLLLSVLILPPGLSGQEDDAASTAPDYTNSKPADIPEALPIMPSVTFVTVTLHPLPPPPPLPASLKQNPRPWLCPGLGHFDIGEPVKGSVLLGLFSVPLISAVSLEIAGWLAYKKHLSVADEALASVDYARRAELMDSAVLWYDRYNTRHSWGQAAFVVAGAVWAYSLFDYHHSLRGRIAPQVSFSLRPQGYALCFHHPL